MKAYTTEEINVIIDQRRFEDETLMYLKRDKFKQWMIDNGHREEGKPLNRWYKHGDGAIIYFNEDRMCYGFDPDNEGWNIWERRYGFVHDFFELCPEEEWKAMLINEAKNRGYEDGNYISTMGGKGIKSKVFTIIHDTLYHENGSRELFNNTNGQWAEIIPEVPEYTMTEAIEKMGHKFKLVDESKG